MEVIGVMGCTGSGKSSIVRFMCEVELGKADQYLRSCIGIEYSSHLRSFRELQEVIEHGIKQLSTTNSHLPSGLERKLDSIIKRASHQRRRNMESHWRNYHDAGITPSREAPFGIRAANYIIQKQTKPFERVARYHATTFPGDLSYLNLADADAPDLPFYDFRNSFRPIFDGSEAIKSGGSSQVFRVLLHLGRMDGYGGEGREEITFAVKKISSGTYQEYARERDAYRRLSLAQNPHPHIAPLFATYRMEGKYHFVFPPANSDLARYWRTQPRPDHDKRSLEWFGGQMRGLADALSTVHGLNGVHGDLKPENILCFGSGGRETVLALTDFGSSCFLTPEEKEFPKSLKHTPVYRAPEVDTKSGITQAYDIWSLGCVFAEAIAWFYDGKAGLSKLIRARLDERDNSSSRDAFFRLEYDIVDMRYGLTAKLKPEVQRVLISLRGNSSSSFFIDDMLYLVLEGMLKIDMNERMSSHKILDALTQMCMKLDNDPAYSEPRDGNPNGIMRVPMEMVHTQNARQRLDRTVDATYYTNTTTQNLRDTAAQFGLKLRFACPYHKADHASNNTSLSTINSTSSNGISQYKDYLRSRGAEEYAAKLAENGIAITVDAASKLLELQVKELGTFDETMQGPVRAYGIPSLPVHEKTGNSAPSNLNGSSDFMDRFQLLAGFEDDKDL
ncbi:serine threonine kinase [Fusarium mexicanum]|uniref:Serine threonine kinase n=1 Tax=Fusarium mexicanum TaxID=751941 RepID=A0A8H5JHC4_9HYPO|nr:serine threonine kinase [Fusarium mexicanum]